MVGDQVVLMSNIVQLPLHASHAQLVDNDDSFEVNASASPTPWKLSLFLEYHRAADEVLKGGDVVRLFHAEQEKVHAVEREGRGGLVRCGLFRLTSFMRLSPQPAPVLDVRHVQGRAQGVSALDRACGQDRGDLVQRAVGD